MPFLLTSCMFRRRKIAVILAVLVVLAAASSFLVWRHLSRPALLPLKSLNGSIVDLGFTFVPLNRSNSETYGPGADNGSLVTAVEKGSLAEEAGLKAGDLILALNGVDLNDNKSLLGLIRGCPADSRVTLQVQDATGVRKVLLCSPGQCAPN
jgi:membrane-associated protease RseP (regulator of RpoE activity)